MIVFLKLLLASLIWVAIVGQSGRAAAGVQERQASTQRVRPTSEEVLGRQIAGCAAVSGGLERLECFDTLARKMGLAGPQAVPVQLGDTGKWQVSVDRNPVDDSERVVLALAADSGLGKWGDPVGLYLRCKSSKTEMYISWNTYLGDDSHDVYDEWKNVLTRIGSAKAETSRWDVSTDNDATFAPGWAGDWLKRMVKADTFLAQVTPHSESPITAQFDTRGLRNALEPLTKACDWSL